MVELEDQNAYQKEQKMRTRRAWVWLAATALIGLMVGMMLGRLINPLPAPGDKQLLWQINEVDKGFYLTLHAPGHITYQRFTHDDALGFIFENVELETSPQVGRYGYQDKTISWRLENRQQGVQLLLVGLKTSVNAEVKALTPLAGRAGLEIAVTGE